MPWLINVAMRLEYFPIAWRTADVTRVPKAGKDRTLLGYCRLISLLSNMSKVVESIILSRLLDNVTNLDPEVIALIFIKATC